MNTTKMDLCRRISEAIEKSHNDIKIKDIKVVIDSCFEEILGILSEGQRLEIRGFGCFCVKNRKARIGRNPRTGAIVTIEEYKTPYFKFSKDARTCFEKKIEQNT